LSPREFLVPPEVGSWSQGHFGNPEEGKRSLLEGIQKKSSEERGWEHLSVCDSDL
jgi:hypothetical protein